MTHQDVSPPEDGAKVGAKDRAFNRLLSSWLKHEELRSSRAPIASLAASRAELDGARLQAYRGLPGSPVL